MRKPEVRQERRRVVSWLVGLFAFLLISSPVILADQGPGGGMENTSSADSSNFLTNTANKIGSGLGRLFGLDNLFSELSPADVGHKPRVRPHFTFNQGFVSNARLASNQADAAWQARIAPGITVAIPSGKLYTEADYTYAFATTQGRKTNANINTHNLTALARYDLSADTVFGVGNNLQFSEVPGTGGDTFVLETATAQVKHRLSSKLTANISDTFQWFNDRATSRENDFVDNGVVVGLGYDVNSDLTVGPTFAWNVRHFDELSGAVDRKDYWQIQPGVSAGYRLGPKTKLAGNFGWAFRKFDKGKGSNDTESELVYGASATHKLGQKLVWDVYYAKTLQDTFDTSFVFKDTPEVSALDNLDRDYRVMKSHRIGSSATYHLNESNSIGAFGDFQFLDAESKDRIVHAADLDEKAMEIGARYSFRFNRYITFDVLYAFGRRFTAESGPSGRADYTFHKVTGGVNIAV